MAECNKKLGTQKVINSNGGFTIIELLLSVTIMLIVSAAIFSFMIFSSKLFNRTTTETNLQQEAQIIKNHLNDRITETGKGLEYLVYPATSPYNADACLIIYGEKSISYFAWRKNEQKICFLELQPKFSELEGEEDQFEVDFDGVSKDASTWAVMAEHVSDFSCNLSEVKEEHQIFSCNLKLEEGIYDYETTHTITLRNQIFGDKNLKELYQIQDELVENIVTGVTLSTDMADVEPGGKWQFTAEVSGIGGYSKEVLFSVEGSNGSSTITKDGLLTVGAGETSPTLTVVCSSKQNPAITAFSLVNVAKIKSITIKCNTVPPYQREKFFIDDKVEFEARVDADFITETGKAVDWEIISSQSGTEDVMPDFESKGNNKCTIRTGKLVGNEITLRATPKGKPDSAVYGEYTISIAQISLGDLYVEIDHNNENYNSEYNDEYKIERAGALPLRASVRGEENQNDINFQWSVKESLNGNVTVTTNNQNGSEAVIWANKDIPYDEEYSVTVKVTASKDGSESKELEREIKIERVKINFEPQTAIVVPNSNEPASVHVSVSGIKNGEKELSYTKKTLISGFNVTPDESGKEWLFSIGKKTIRKNATVQFEVKNDRSRIREEFKVYFKEGNVVPGNFYAPAPGDDLFPECDKDGTPLKNSSFVLNSRRYDYCVVTLNNKKQWYLEISNEKDTEGSSKQKYIYNFVKNKYEIPSE